MLRYITLRCVTLRYFSLHYIALNHITLRYVTLRYVTLRYVTLRCLLQTDWNDGSVLVSLIQSLGGSIPGWPDHVDRSNHQAIIEKGRSGQALKPSYKKVGQAVVVICQTARFHVLWFPEPHYAAWPSFM